MIDIYLISINQLLTQRCGGNTCSARADLLCFKHEKNTVPIVIATRIFTIGALHYAFGGIILVNQMFPGAKQTRHRCRIFENFQCVRLSFRRCRWRAFNGGR